MDQISLSAIACRKLRRCCKSTMVEVETRGFQVSEIDRSRSTKSWECTQSTLVKPALSITGESILITRTDVRFYAVEE